MVKIRLSRTGKTHQISYRIVAQDSRAKRDGAFLEILGFYNPTAKQGLAIKKDRLDYWTSRGAKPTAAVARLISQKDERLTPEIKLKLKA